MPRRKLIIGVACILASVGVWLAWSQPQDMPSATETTAVMRPGLDPTEHSESEAGKPTAAGTGASVALEAVTRKDFQRSQYCVFSMRAESQRAQRRNVCANYEQYANQPDKSAFYESCSIDMAKLGKLTAVRDRSSSECHVGDALSTERSFFYDTVRAAIAGDSDAQVCYLGSRFRLDREFTEAEMEQYKKLASRFAREGLERGDWRVTEVLRRATPAVVQQNALMAHLPELGPLMLYRMNRLQAMAANNEQYAAFLEINAAGLERRLSKQEVAEAQSWAQAYFQQYFSHSGKLNTYPRNCTLEVNEAFDLPSEI